MIARLWRFLFPPTPLPGDDGRNATMRRLLGPQTPLLSVTPAQVDARLAALQPPKPPPVRTAVERLEEGVERAVAAAEEQMARESMERR